MPITRTTDLEVRTLVSALGSSDPARREAAIARLIIIGERTHGRLAAAFDEGDRLTQLGVLRVLESDPDDRALATARRALTAGDDVAVAAVGVLRELLARGAGRLQTDALDLLLAVSADPAAARRVRAAAAEALNALPEDVRGDLDQALPPVPPPDAALWEDACDGRLPDDPAVMRDALAAHGNTTPLEPLRRLIEHIRTRERQTADVHRRQRWRAVRGAAHQALALRGSLLALYDLRETFEDAEGPLPATFLAAVQLVGDASCLEPLAAAYARGSAEPRWRAQLVEAFEAVARRARVTRRNPAMRRALTVLEKAGHAARR